MIVMTHNVTDENIFKKQLLPSVIVQQYRQHLL